MKLMIMSDAPMLNTGYGQNTYNLLNELDQLGHEVACLALGHAGEPVRYKHFDIYPGATPFMMQKSVQKYRPDAVLHIRDNWIFIPKYVPQAYSLIGMCHAAGAKLINYTPVQAAPLPPEFVETISTQADFTYITNQFGMDQLIEQGAPKDKLGVMYNGVDAGTFRNMNVPRKGTGLPDDKKLAIFVGANMDYRKAIPLAMLTFKRYLEKEAEKPTPRDAALYLHTNPFGGFDLPVFIKNLDLQGRCFLKSGDGMKLMTWDLQTNEMAAMYNMGDAFLTCTASEGFNEPALEAFATGLPVVLTDTPIHREIFSCFGDRAFFIPAKEVVPTVWTFEHSPDPDAGAELLAKAFDMGKKGINMRQFPQFSWTKIAEKFAEEAEKVIEQPFEDQMAGDIAKADIQIANMRKIMAERDAKNAALKAKEEKA